MCLTKNQIYGAQRCLLKVVIFAGNSKLEHDIVDAGDNEYSVDNKYIFCIKEYFLFIKSGIYFPAALF